jgi:hypothetical protein
VRGINTSGEAFEIETVLDNLSASGLYLRLPQQIEPGARLFIIIRFSTASNDNAFRVAIRGKVLRAEAQPDGNCGLGIEFERHRFI